MRGVLGQLLWRLVDPVRQVELERCEREIGRLRQDLKIRDDALTHAIHDLAQLQGALSECRIQLAESNSLVAQRHWYPEGTPDEDCDDPV